MCCYRQFRVSLKAKNARKSLRNGKKKKQEHQLIKVDALAFFTFFNLSLNKEQIRTLLQFGKCSDYVLLVRQMGLEPIRRRHTPLKRACLPIPALPQNIANSSFATLRIISFNYLFVNIIYHSFANIFSANTFKKFS